MEALSVVYNINSGTLQESEPPALKKLVSLYVGDLHPDVVDDDLACAFYEFRSLASVKVCRDYWTKESIGYGFINFHNRADGIWIFTHLFILLLLNLFLFSVL